MVTSRFTNLKSTGKVRALRSFVDLSCGKFCCRVVLGISNSHPHGILNSHPYSPHEQFLYHSRKYIDQSNYPYSIEKFRSRKSEKTEIESKWSLTLAACSQSPARFHEDQIHSIDKNIRSFRWRLFPPRPPSTGYSLKQRQTRNKFKILSETQLTELARGLTSK